MASDVHLQFDAAFELISLQLDMSFVESSLLALGLVLALSTHPASTGAVVLDILPNLANLTRINSTRTYSTGVKETLEITCTGDYFGFNPSIPDCYSALGHIPPDHQQFLWGLRHTGLGDSVFPLPYRMMGGEFLCHGRYRLLTALP